MLRTLTCAAVAALPLLVSAQAASPAPLTLDAALAEAERGNPDVAAAKARLDQARAGVASARSRYLPRLEGSASYTRNSDEVKLQIPYAYTIRDVGGPTSGAGLPGAPTNLAAVPTGVSSGTLQPREQLGAQLELTQAILAPAAWYGIEAAGASARASAETAEVVRREIRFGVAQAYYAATAADRVVAIQDRQLALAQAHERDARVQVEAGMQPKIVLLRASIETARVAQDLERARNGARVARSTLAALLGRRDDADLTLAPPPPPALPPDLSRLDDEALQRRPELRAARAGVDAATLARRAVTARYLPTLGAFGQLRWQDPAGLTGKEQTWAAGLALSWTFLDGGAREADRREASARLAEADARLAAAAVQARDEVRRARLELASARANREKAEQQVALARENQRLVDVAFRAGQSTSLEATDANAALATAELAAANESLAADLAALRLLRAAGS